jgi:Niemann-Pick C1 protein
MAAVVEVIGFSHYMGVKMNGISTIYYLICAGLAVDYSAHIAHVFKDSTGTSVERAVAAMIRIGPSVWNAVFSTLLAVLVLGFSKSYVFIVFFKVLLLVALIAGSHGLVLLPVLLSVAGGSNEVKVADNKVEHNKPSE